MEFLWNTTLSGLTSYRKAYGVNLKNVQTGRRRSDLALDGLFISIGRAPETGLFAGQIALDDQGYIAADETTRTSLPGSVCRGRREDKA